MSVRKKLETTLSEAFRVESPDDRVFLLGRPAGSPVRVVASEADVAARARLIAPDALLALGEIDDDRSGMMAAVGLLAIHVEELVASRPSVILVRITPTGVTDEDGLPNVGSG